MPVSTLTPTSPVSTRKTQTHLALPPVGTAKCLLVLNTLSMTSGRSASTPQAKLKKALKQRHNEDALTVELQGYMNQGTELRATRMTRNGMTSSPRNPADDEEAPRVRASDSRYVSSFLPRTTLTISRCIPNSSPTTPHALPVFFTGRHRKVSARSQYTQDAKATVTQPLLQKKRQKALKQLQTRTLWSLTVDCPGDTELVQELRAALAAARRSNSGTDSHDNDEEDSNQTVFRGCGL
ncbi:hypothetical protein FB45DRAFT_1048704 [Roridomyces roridus]|uniref:Uncharacterized protein n=1 Tax=Roridomyces roridus TaxID=1738132 RepID=A0AAD7F7N1_9AGAR|nr:hypothetical protein FB45DRAFT_1048704 [Roridomyces roridus]